MSNLRRHRYPGLVPFRPDQQEVFFGRSSDLDRLADLVLRRQQVLLYGKSGYGKSSLIQAGLIPLLAELPQSVILPIRIGTYLDETSISPVDSIRSSMPAAPETFLDKIIPADGALWSLFKGHSLVAGDARIYYLIFDQFEELFSHPESRIFTFKKQLAMLLYRVVPQHFREVWELKQRDGTLSLTAEELEQLYAPMEIRVLYAIREDRYSELNHLTDHLPDLVHNKYRLLPLSRKQAEEAILKPAALELEFDSPPFEYSRDALDKMLDFLTQRGEIAIETTQLQILCSRIERIGKVRIELADVPAFDNLFLEFYEESIGQLAEGEHSRARTFIETKMVLHQQRIAYHRLACLEYLSEEGLEILLRDRHLFRAEPSTTGGVSYELAHDTLVAPILLAKQQREKSEAAEAAEQRRVEHMALQKAAADRMRDALAKANRERKRQRNRFRVTAVALGVALAAMIFGFIQWRYAKQNESDAISARDSAWEAESETQKAYESLKNAQEREAAAQKMLLDRSVADLTSRARQFVAYSELGMAKSLIEIAVSLDPRREDLRDSLILWRRE